MYGYTGDNRIHNENEILYIRIPINKYMYIVYVFVQNKKFTKHTWDRNTPHWSCKEYEKLTCLVEDTTIKDWHK